MEPVTIVVVQRDRHSTTARCLDTLLKDTAGFKEVIVVLCAVPEKIKKDLTARFGEKVRFIFEPVFRNQSETRNIGLRETKTRLAVLMDNDVFVRPGWLEPLVRCERETGAKMVVPMILEGKQTIHTAGNDLLITYQNGKPFGQKVLRFAKMTLYESSNLKRQKTDYGELHSQLVEVETAKRLGVYDDQLREVGEVDSGLSWSKAGFEQWFEPESVVFYEFPIKITDADDIRPFLFKWDMREILKNYQYFEKKWNLDITECGNWKKHLLFINNRLGVFSRLWPSPLSLMLDNGLKELRALPARLSPMKLWRRLKARLAGYDEW